MSSQVILDTNFIISCIKQKIEFIFKILNGNLRFEKIREIKISDNKDKELFFLKITPFPLGLSILCVAKK